MLISMQIVVMIQTIGVNNMTTKTKTKSLESQLNSIAKRVNTLLFKYEEAIQNDIDIQNSGLVLKHILIRRDVQTGTITIACITGDYNDN